jgi:hypothetical protein
MKSFTYFLLIVTFFATITSCQENGIVFPVKQNIKGDFEVVIDGKFFLTNDVSFSVTNQEITITAIKTDTNETLILKVDDFSNSSFSFEGVENVASYSIEDSTNTNIWTTLNATVSRGKIQFSDINFTKNTVSGTFSFIGRNETLGALKAFGSGSFNNVPRN